MAVNLVTIASSGLRTFGPQDRDISTGFGFHQVDRIELEKTLVQRLPVVLNCRSCHNLPGVYSFNSFVDFSRVMRDNLQAKIEDHPLPIQLSEISPQRATQVAIEWKEQFSDWKLLQDLMLSELKE